MERVGLPFGPQESTGNRTTSDPNLIHLIQRDLIPSPVVQLRRSRPPVPCQLLLALLEVWHFALRPPTELGCVMMVFRADPVGATAGVTKPLDIYSKGSVTPATH